MAKRYKMNRRKSEKYFTKAADRVHKKNLQSSSAGVFVMRGGTRL